MSKSSFHYCRCRLFHLFQLPLSVSTLSSFRFCSPVLFCDLQAQSVLCMSNLSCSISGNDVLRDVLVGLGGIGFWCICVLGTVVYRLSCRDALCYALRIRLRMFPRSRRVSPVFQVLEVSQLSSCRVTVHWKCELSTFPIPSTSAVTVFH